VFVRAGAAFHATVTARTFGGAATPSFGGGSNNGTETVDLTRTRVAPTGVGAADGTLGGTTAILRSSFSNGIATVSDLNWSEVGVITLTATNSTFLGNALTTTGATGNIGRFYPDHFDTEVVLSSGLPMPCPTGLTCPTLYDGFVYSGQAFTARVTARNLAGGATQNYDGTLGYARATTLQAWDARGSTTEQDPNGSLANIAVAAATFSASVATTGTPVYTLTSTPTAPTDIYMRATDSDGVTSLRAVSVEGGVKVLSGRVRVSNAYGSERLPLTLFATAQYFTGTGWVNSITDSITSLTLAAKYDVMKNGLKTGETTPAPTGAVTLNAGQRNIVLSPPGGATGVATISPTVPSYLPLTPGTATFGIYKSNSRFIYRREN
jgi:MSHA biogenesis protein MshQ